MCIDAPSHDFVIGNVEGFKFPDMTHFSLWGRKKKHSKNKFIRQNRQELLLKQASDVKLKEIRRRVEYGSVTKNCGFSSGETKFSRRISLIHRHFKKNAKVLLQLVVPSSLTQSFRNLGHESLRVVNHVGRKETISRALSELYWPSVCREVT